MIQCSDDAMIRSQLIGYVTGLNQANDNRDIICDGKAQTAYREVR